jgi:hypothetical protein
MSKTKLILLLSLLLLAAVSCNSVASTPEPTSTPLPPTVTPELTVIVEPTSTSTPNNVPLSESQVERVPVQGAWAALQNGGAIIVDVRSAEAYAESHIKGAISIPLAEIENNPTGLKLDKDQWIITYCT